MSLWKKLFSGGKTAAEPAPAPAPALSAAIPDTLRWIEAEESPFGVRFLDCRAVALTRRTPPQDKTIEGRWARERANDGRRLSGTRPEHAVELPTLLLAPMSETLPADGPVFKGDSLDEKWDAYLFEGWLYLVRSWSGLLVYRAAVKAEGGKLVIDRIDAPRDAADSDPEFCVREVDFLVKSLLYRVQVPHPLPRDFQQDDAGIADFSFQRHGHRGQFATYHDTLGVDPWKGAPRA